MGRRTKTFKQRMLDDHNVRMFDGDERYQCTPSVLAEGMVVGGSQGKPHYIVLKSPGLTWNNHSQVPIRYIDGEESIRQWNSDMSVSVNVWIVGVVNDSPASKGER